MSKEPDIGALRDIWYRRTGDYWNEIDKAFGIKNRERDKRIAATKEVWRGTPEYEAFHRDTFSPQGKERRRR